MNVEDSLKLGAGVALTAIGITLVTRSFSSAVTVEYRGTTKKTDHRNDRLLGGVDVPLVKGETRKSSEANNDDAKKQSSVNASLDTVTLKSSDGFSDVVVDDGCPVDLLSRYGNNCITRFIAGVIGGARYGFAHAHSLKRLKLGNLNRSGSAA